MKIMFLLLVLVISSVSFSFRSKVQTVDLLLMRISSWLSDSKIKN